MRCKGDVDRAGFTGIQVGAGEAQVVIEVGDLFIKLLTHESLIDHLERTDGRVGGYCKIHCKCLAGTDVDLAEAAAVANLQDLRITKGSHEEVSVRIDGHALGLVGSSGHLDGCCIAGSQISEEGVASNLGNVKIIRRIEEDFGGTVEATDKHSWGPTKAGARILKDLVECAIGNVQVPAAVKGDSLGI